ncbi:hypothetical protein IWX46DRAFT_580643 [Phyllosticta citricarpa]|uniref:Zn(2)-C6 fungal-type domain-containing protein n=1 Tax=Phyllosticta citricarpa TaxID=55181 RepID=A0ABR1MEQ5_9PEZI
MSDQNDCQDSVSKKLLSRRSHRKSRTGCGNCKTRRIKCDETKPECINCSKHDLRCDYVTGILGQKTAPPAPSTDEPFKRKRGRPRKIHNPSPAFAAPTPQPTPRSNVGATPGLTSNAPSPTSLETPEDGLVDLDLMHHFSLHGHGNYRGVRDYGSPAAPPPTDWRRHMEDLRRIIPDANDPKGETCLEESTRLNQSYVAVWGDQEEMKENPYMSSIFAWIYRTSNDFILCIQQKQPLALLIFAFLGVLMTSPPEHHWFMKGWPQHVVAGAYTFLPQEYRPWLQWHIEQVSWTPGTSTTP